MAVLKLVEFSNRDTVSALRCLLADASAGRITGVAVCFRTSDGCDDAAFTGAFKARPGEGAKAAQRLAWQLAAFEGVFK